MEYYFCWSLKISSFEFFGDEKYSILWAKKLMEIWYLLVKGFCFDLFGNGKYGLFLCQKDGGKMIFTDYWNFFFGDGKYGLFWVKKLIERWYLLVTEKFFFRTFQWGEIRYFFQSKRWWKDYIYMVFFSLPWYSRAREIWFFVQCVI